MSRRRAVAPLPPVLLATLLLAATGGLAFAAQADAPVDTLAAATADSVAAGPPAAGGASLDALLRQAGQAGAAAPDAAAGTVGGPYFMEWLRTPTAQVRAEVRKVTYSGGLSTSLKMRDRSSFSADLGYSEEDYRRQNKIVERRDGSANYSTDPARDLTLTLNLSDRWSEDRVTNAAGVASLNKTDLKQGTLGITRTGLDLGGLSHDLALNGMVTDQSGVLQRQRNDSQDALLSGGLRSAWRPSAWVTLNTGVYGETRGGRRSLGEFTDDSSADGDSLRANVSYERRVLSGMFRVENSSFDKSYLDYRRNANGIIDTIGVSEKVVRELETNDAVSLGWDNTLALGSFTFKSKVARDLSEDEFRASGVGRKERHQDSMTLTAGLRVTRLDSVSATYGYLWKWDDQIYKGATGSRGRQIQKRRDLSMAWYHDLFANTILDVAYKTGLAQEIAQNQFNKNDRDRLEESFGIAMNTRWDGGMRVGLAFDWRRVEDLSIRRERSSNNNLKDTYELAPNYDLPITPWLKLKQDYRIWIQYTDYVYDELEAVSKTDIYNKRGNVTTQVDMQFGRRVKLNIRHDYSIKRNATESGGDAAGNTYYRDDSEQRVSTIDFSLAYTVSSWLTLDGTTEQSKDLKDSFGLRPTSTDRRSGEVGVGGKISKRWGDSRQLDATVRRYFAYGPNVQETTRDYWDADIKLSWRF